MNTTHTRNHARGRWHGASPGTTEGMHETPTTSATSSTSRTPGRGARRGLIALVLALAALLLALGAPAAQADPPKVMASENPVIIPYTTDTKDITLTWTLEPLQPLATLTVTESGTPAPVLDDTVSALPGDNRPLTVTYGKTYTAQLKDVANKQPLGAPLTITTDRVDIKIDVGCLVQCITSVVPDPHGGWAKFTINATEAAYITLETSTTEPNPDGTWRNPGAVSSTATILPTQSWTPALADLNSNTTYHYVVRAHDTNGNEQFKTGSFKTLTRRVEVTLAEIEMIDDTDGFGAGDCDCFFWFNAGDETPKPYGSFENPKSIASGTTVHPNVTFTINNAPTKIWIRAMGYDDDTDFGEFCSEGPGYPPYTGTASWIVTSGMAEDCLQVTGDQVTVSVSRQGQPAAPDAVDEQFTEKFTISAGLGPLVYKVHGTYKVTFA